MTFYKGTSYGQDGRFINKDKRLINTLEFPEEYKNTVNISKINLEIIKSWIERKLNDLLGFEDECISGYIINQLQETEELINPKKLQYSLTGFLENSTYDFMREFWKILLSAQNAPDGIPVELIEDKKQEIINKTQKKKEKLKFLDDLLGKNINEEIDDKNNPQLFKNSFDRKSLEDDTNNNASKNKRELPSSSSSSSSLLSASGSKRSKDAKKKSNSKHHHHHRHHHQKRHNHYDNHTNEHKYQRNKNKSSKRKRSRSRDH